MPEDWGSPEGCQDLASDRSCTVARCQKIGIGGWRHAWHAGTPESAYRRSRTALFGGACWMFVGPNVDQECPSAYGESNVWL